MIALDNIWEKESLGWKLKEIQYGSLHKIEIERTEKSNSDKNQTPFNRKSSAENTNQSTDNKPSKRVIKQLLNNLRLPHSSLEKILKLASVHIPTLNLTESYVMILLQQR